MNIFIITNGNFGSISHQGRIFIALSVFYRYAGLSEENEPPAAIRELVPPAMDERARVLGAAFRVARGPRPGPVLVDVPNDILKAKCAPMRPLPVQHAHTIESDEDAASIEAALDLLASAKRPLVLVGGG